MVFFKFPFPYFNIQSVHVCIQFTTHLQKIQNVHLVPVERESCWYACGICTNRHRYHLCTLTYVDYINKCHHYNVHTIPLIPKSNEKLKHTSQSQHSYIITFITLPHAIIHISHCDITNWSHRPLIDDITRRSLHTSFTNIQSHMHTRTYTHRLSR